MIEKLPIFEPVKYCPLCQKVLLETYWDQGIEYFCQTRIKFEGKTSVPHYEILADGAQYFYSLPAHRLTVKNGKTTIWEILKEDGYNSISRKPYWNFVLEIPREIAPTNDEKLVDKIKTLLIFS